MLESMRVRRGLRVVSAGFVIGVGGLSCTAIAASAATPIVSIGPTTSPTGGTVTGTVASTGQTDACLSQDHSGVDPSQSNPPGAVQIADRSCGATTGTGTPTTAGSGGGGAGSGTAGGGTQTSSSQTGSSQTASKTKSTTVSRKAAGSTSSNSNGTSRLTTRSVWAGSARGLRIAHVASKVVQTKPGKRLRVLVTLRDGKQRLVRSATVSIGGLFGAKSTLPRLHVGFTNKKGQAIFLVPITKSMFGHRVLFRVGARTPTAQAHKVTATQVPKQRHKKVLRYTAGG